MSEPAADPAPVYPERPWLVAGAVMSATFMEVLDTTVVNVSLPHIAGSLSATPEEATWSLTSYLVANAVILPLTGWLGQRIGRRRLLLSSVVGFTLASVLCGLATSLAAAFGEVSRQAATLAFIDAYRMLSFVALLLIPLVPFLGRTPRARSGGPPMH